jgi:PAS domain S-box-containing protein
MSFTASAEKSARLFHHLFEEASLGIAVEDLEGRILLANPALCSILGFQEEELCAMSCSEFANPEDSQDDWALFQKLRAGLIDRYSIEKRYVRKDGVQIWGRLNVSLLQSSNGETPLVFAFVEEVTDRKLAEETLHASEARLQLAAQAGKMYAFEWDVETDMVTRTAEHMNILGLTEPLPLTRHQLLARIHPDDRAKFNASVANLSSENPTNEFTYRVLRSDGGVIWLEARKRAFFDAKGKLLRVIGMAADVTNRMLAEQALSQVSRRLIEAQEKERNRIGRDLHDDIGQRLALLAVQLQQVKQTLPDSAAELNSRLDELQKQTAEISADVQALSHELHSSKLEYLGLAAAMRAFCKEFGEQQRVEIGFRSHDLPSPLPSPEISLCLFRVLQEAIHNASKHSGVRHFEVRLWGMPSEIHLTVSDSGAGFDTQARREGRGLGLTSMEERLKLINGELSIESQPKGGTTIYARAPLSADSKSERAG